MVSKTNYDPWTGDKLSVSQEEFYCMELLKIFNSNHKESITANPQ
jgi:hypothetical protein